MVESLGYHERKNWDEYNQCMNIQEGDKVSGATLTELLIRNQIQRQRSRIMPRLAKILQQDTKRVNLIDATKVICALTHMYVYTYNKYNIWSSVKSSFFPNFKVYEVLKSLLQCSLWNNFLQMPNLAHIPPGKLLRSSRKMLYNS